MSASRPPRRWRRRACRGLASGARSPAAMIKREAVRDRSSSAGRCVQAMSPILCRDTRAATGRVAVGVELVAGFLRACRPRSRGVAATPPTAAQRTHQRGAPRGASGLSRPPWFAPGRPRSLGGDPFPSPCGTRQRASEPISCRGSSLTGRMVNHLDVDPSALQGCAARASPSRFSNRAPVDHGASS
jgi:hypothetical protein